MFKSIKLNREGKEESKILLIYTGGTLGMFTTTEDSPLKPLDFEEIIDHIPELESLSCDIDIHAMEKPIDSSDMNPETWTRIGEEIFKKYHEYDGFVIIHGTDTMVYTASALSYMFENQNKPIILTGSQMPLGLARSDARKNLTTSLEVAQLKNNGDSLIKEVCIFFDDFLLRGNRAKKIENDQFDAFHSENYYPLAEVGIDIDIHEHYLWRAAGNGDLVFRNKFSQNVFNWKIFPGMRVKGISDVFINAGFKGIIIETYGAGNAPTDDDFLGEIKKLINAGIHVLNVSQCLGGSVRQGRYATSKKMDDLGVISGTDITSEAAIVKMMYLLANYEASEIPYLLRTSIRGEMTDYKDLK